MNKPTAVPGFARPTFVPKARAEFEALAAPMEFPPESAVARAGGPEGYEQLCAVEAEVTVGGRRSEVRCLGQRDHAWGAPRWDRIEQARRREKGASKGLRGARNTELTDAPAASEGGGTPGSASSW